MLNNALREYQIILGSGSPRRQAYLREMGIDFEVRTKSIPENYPHHLKGAEISEFLAQLKARAFMDGLREKDILITSDTVVWHRETSLAKPENREEAIAMLCTLSGDSHDVITSICITQKKVQRTVTETTQVRFKALDIAEIEYYVDRYKPYDKAGGYGIQEWIGLIGITQIRGSYANVVGLPTHLLYKTLMQVAGDGV
ncbi:MAG: Maf family nucleotide pyrophosphatase [Bacteroidota bacterium]